ncbi:MAG: porin family protein [Alphaproteobacteria bacterium]|nr:porin family protein [Alphaproteobacteria bacterium]
MKRSLLFTLCLLITHPVWAQTYDASQGYSYSQSRVEQGYNADRSYQAGAYGNAAYDTSVPAPASPQAYGFYQQPTPAPYSNVTPQRSSQMMWYPTQQQRLEAGLYGASYETASAEQKADPYRSPVYNSKEVRRKRPFYADFRLGIGVTMGWPSGLDKPVSPIWGVAVGTRMSPTVRVDAEFDYHTEGKLATEEHRKIKYKQYDFGANIYYDFPVNAALRVYPFVGAGIWAVKGKANGKYQGLKVSSTSDINLGLSVAGGVTYPINEMFSLVAMARARYIHTDDNLYNLEGLIGVRYHF